MIVFSNPNSKGQVCKALADLLVLVMFPAVSTQVRHHLIEYLAQVTQSSSELFSDVRFETHPERKAFEVHMAFTFVPPVQEPEKMVVQ